MSTKLTIFTKNNDGDCDVFDVSTLVQNISYFTTLEAQPGKLNFTLLRDPKKLLKLKCGSAVTFFHNSYAVFSGYIFNIQIDSKGNYEVTAFDQLRYLQNHDYINVKEGTSLYDFLNIIINKININLSNENDTIRFTDYLSSLGKETYKLPTKLFPDNSYFDMISWAFNEIQKTSIDKHTYNKRGLNVFNTKLYIYDNFGQLSVSEVDFNIYSGKDEDLTNKIIIGDESLLTDYNIEYDINSDTFNEIIICKSTEATKNNKLKFPYSARKRYEDMKRGIKTGFTDKDTVKDFGLLQKVVNVNDDATDEQIEHYADVALFAQNKVFKTFSLSAIGFDGLRAGSTFTLRLNKLGICHKVYANSVTHNYEGEKHTMDIEVCIGDNVLRDTI